LRYFFQNSHQYFKAQLLGNLDLPALHAAINTKKAGTCARKVVQRGNPNSPTLVEKEWKKAKRKIQWYLMNYNREKTIFRECGPAKVSLPRPFSRQRSLE